jgi:hypothetical protein
MSFATQPLEKIAWTPAMMSERDHFVAIGQIGKDDEIREGMNRHLSNFAIGDARYSPADLRKRCDEIQCAPDFRREAFRDTRISILIPA